MQSEKNDGSAELQENMKRLALHLKMLMDQAHSIHRSVGIDTRSLHFTSHDASLSAQQLKTLEVLSRELKLVPAQYGFKEVPDEVRTLLGDLLDQAKPIVNANYE